MEALVPLSEPDATADRKKHCWECLRRRLICDSTQPICNRCRTASLVCPGYGDQKPLRWLRPRQASGSGAKKKKKTREAAPAKPKSPGKVALGVNVLPKEETDDALVLYSNLGPLQKGYLEVHQAIDYYNKCIYPDYAPLRHLAPDSFVMEIPLWAAPLKSTTAQLLITCYSLGHRIHRLPKDASPQDISKAWINFYHKRGQAIQSLREDMDSLDPQYHLETMAVISTFCVLDVQQCCPSWQLHRIGLIDVVQRLGGLGKLMMPDPPGLCLARISAHIFLNIIVFGNASSPIADQITSIPYDNQIRAVSAFYDCRLTPQLMCPAHIMLSLVHINRLRCWQYSPSLVEDFALYAGEDLLEHINTFDPASWALSLVHNNERADLEALGCLHQSAIALYCILALQSVGRLGATAAIETQKKIHTARLFSLLRSLISAPGINKCLMWGFVVGGVAAVETCADDRAFVRENLPDLRRALGQEMPMMLRNLLDSFWASGKTRWDDCFDKAYYFCT